MTTNEVPSHVSRMETDEARREAARFEQSLHRDHPWVWWTTLLGPVAATFAVVAVLAAAHGWGYVRKLAATAVVTFFLLGRFVILGGESQSAASGGFLSAEALVAMVLFMDLVCACLIAFHAGFLWKLPLVGRRIQALADEGRALAASRPWVKRATFASIVAFVMFPLAATGSIGGSLFGRLLGMGRGQTFLAVLLGSVLGCVAMYFGAALINRYFDRDSLLVKIGGPACIVVIILVLTYRFRKLTAARPTPPHDSP